MTIISKGFDDTGMVELNCSDISSGLAFEDDLGMRKRIFNRNKAVTLNLGCREEGNKRWHSNKNNLEGTY